jgi:AcrR family transcriptional regulator
MLKRHFISDYMADRTEQKILEAALEIFSQKGYIGATTISIAEKAGFSEKTLFRKFKTKKNLFDMVITENSKRFKNGFNLIITGTEFESPKDFLEVLIKDIANLTDKYYEYVNLAMTEGSRISINNAAKEIPYYLAEYIEKNMKSRDIDYQIFAVTILSFIYILIGDKYYGRTFVDREEAIDKFINNLAFCVR